jgi:hypothetical protein
MGVPDGLRDALADRYTLERELGRGDMAIVYLAQDLLWISAGRWTTRRNGRCSQCR